MESSDEALVLACRRGDAAAWEALVRRYQRLIYTIPRRAGLNEEQAADIFQHVFEKLVAKLHEIEQPDRVKAWLVTTARRESIRMSQRQRALEAARSQDDDEEETSKLPDETPLPDEVLVHLEEQHLVRMAVSALDDRCARLLSFLFYDPDPPSYGEIAATLAISPGSVGPTRARCLQKLRRLLEEAEL